MAIIDKEDLKDFLDISGSDDDAFLDKCGVWAQGIIESWCKRKFEETEYEEEDYGGDSTSILYLRQYPVIEISAISIDDTPLSNVGSDYVKLNKKTGAVYLVSAVFTKKEYPNVKITYKAGYASDGMPEDVKFAILELAALIYRESPKGGGRLGVDSEMIPEGGTNKFLHRLNPMTLKGVSKYRRVSI